MSFVVIVVDQTPQPATAATATATATRTTRPTAATATAAATTTPPSQIQQSYRAHQIRPAAGYHRAKRAGRSVFRRAVRDAAVGVVTFYAAGDAVVVDADARRRFVFRRMPAKITRHRESHRSVIANPPRTARLFGKITSVVG